MPHRGLRHAHYQLGHLVGFLLEDVARLADREFGLQITRDCTTPRVGTSRVLMPVNGLAIRSFALKKARHAYSTPILARRF
jgi:hypothetical protein